MNVIVMADSVSDGLQPLSHHTSFLLLPVCGRAVIDHVLESLMPLGVNKVTLLVNQHSAKVRKFVGSGERWGMDITFVTTLGTPAIISDVLKRHDPLNDLPCLIIDALYFRSFDVVSVVNRFQSDGGTNLTGVHQGAACGLFYFTKNASGCYVEENDTEKFVELNLEYSKNISTLQSYYEANLWVVENKPDNVLTRGKQRFQNVVSGPGCVITQENADSGSIFAGIDCSLHPDVRCSGIVILGDNVIVDRHTSISNSIVLDETYIGEHLKIENSIVWHNTIIRVDTGAYFTLEDDRLVGNLSKTAIKNRLADLTGRLVALALLVISLPLWLIGFIDASSVHGVNVLEPIRFIGNGRSENQSHRELKSVKIRSRYRILANLPVLIDIIRGKINWFGVSICEPDVLFGRSETWQFIRDNHPVGLIGPAQVEHGDEYSNDEQLLADATLKDFSNTTLIFKAIKNLFAYKIDLGLSSKTSSR